MKKLPLLLVALALTGSLFAQTFTGDVLGSHNLGPGGTGPVQGQGSAACLYCHAPHSGIGGRTPLWSQTLSSQSYTLYSSTTLKNAPRQPAVGGTSSLCLSCHDGTVAVGTKVPGGAIPMTGSMNSKDVFGSELQASHPFSLQTPMVDAPNLVDTLTTTHVTADPQHKVNLIQGSVECNSCHEPHQQNIDPLSLKFLARDSISGQLCLACHSPEPRAVGGNSNPLAQWSTSIHAVSGNNVNAAAGIGNYNTVAQYACTSCHRSHNANGPGTLLRPAVPPATNVDAATQSCMTCHSGGSNLQQPIRNVYAEFAKISHPFPSGSNTHDANEPVVLVERRHATCVDCHNSHASQQVGTFGAPPAIRVSQAGTVGVSTDGTTIVNPAINQYDTCFRCHGSSPNKQVLQVFGYLPLRAVSAADPLNIIPQFSPTGSSHPVTHDASSTLPQPSLRQYMLNLDGVTDSTRQLRSGLGDRLFCTDCHNSDDNREFGGSGPSGPHGSQYGHLMERRYEFSQVAVSAGAGTAIQNLFPNPDLSAGGPTPGPYALCAKCHDLPNVVLNTSFSQHSQHVVNVGVSCSVCHTSHGMGNISGTISGERLVNFDVNVVAPNGSTLAYNRGTNTCTLVCHGATHNSDGSVSAASLAIRTQAARK